ncbi:MAG: AgmX/PglI C-terminal domain-containing protein [Myxococcota bacterium]
MAVQLLVGDVDTQARTVTPEPDLVALLLDPPAPPAAGNADAGAGAPAPEPEGAADEPEATPEPSPASPETVRDRDRRIASTAGIFGGPQFDDVLGTSGLSAALTAASGALIGDHGAPGGQGLGRRGGGLGGGGDVDGLSGGLGTKGLGTGDLGYGASGGHHGPGKTDGGCCGGGPAPVTVLGNMDRALIDEVVKRHTSQIRYCYQRELARAPSMAGKVTIKFTIASDGSVSQAGVKASSLGNGAVEDCIVQRFLHMRFPEPKGGGIVIVSYPFLFSPG